MMGVRPSTDEPDFDDSTAVDSSAVKSLRLPVVVTERKPDFVMDDTTNQMPSARAKVNVQRALQHRPASVPASVPPPGRSVPPPKGRLPSQAPLPPRAVAPRAPAPRPMPSPRLPASAFPASALPASSQAQLPHPQVQNPQQQALLAQQQALLAQQQAQGQPAQMLGVQQPAQAPQGSFGQAQGQGFALVPAERSPFDAHTTGALVVEKPSRRRWWIAAAGLMLLLMVSVFVVAGVMWSERPVPSLQVTSIPPGAQVALAGAPVTGVTPVWVLQGIELGHSYPLVVTLEGYEPAMVQVTPTEAVTRREVVLLPRVSRMRIETEPPGATVFARGAPRAAPITIEGLRMGEMLEVRVEAPGYLPLTQQFNVSAPDSVATLRLQRAP